MVGVRLNPTIEPRSHNTQPSVADPLTETKKVAKPSKQSESKGETAGILKYFEEFLFKPSKKTKRTEENVVCPPKQDLSLSTAVRSLIQETSTKTAVIGTKGVGKTYLFNTLLETTAPSEKEYAEIRDAELFAEKAYNTKQTTFKKQESSSEMNIEKPYVPAAKKIDSATSYSFQDSSSSNSNTETKNQHAPSGAYKSVTSYSFASFGPTVPTDKAYTATTCYSFNEDVPIYSNKSEVPSYTDVTGYSFNELSAATEENDFQWDVGKIEQTLVPDEHYHTSVDWDKEKISLQFAPDDEHSFLLPQGNKVGPHNYFCFELRYGKIPELIITFVDETKLRQELWEIHEIEAGLRRVYNVSHKNFLEARYRTVLGLKKDQKIPLGHIRSPSDFKLPAEVGRLLGKSYRFKGLGKNFSLDRIYIREKLKEVVTSYGFYATNLLLRMPCGVLEGNREIVDFSSVEIPNSKTTQIIGNANLLIVVLDKRGITSDIVEVLRSTGFLEKALKNPDQHKAVLIQHIEPVDSRLPIQLFDPTLTSEFESYKHSVSLQFKLLLSEYANHNWANIERVVGTTSILSVRPRLYSLLYANNNIPAEYLANRSQMEIMSATNVPALTASITNMVLSKCVEPLKEMNSEWMQRYMSTHTTSTTTTTTQEKGSQLVGLVSKEKDLEVDGLAAILDQLTLSFQDKFGRLKSDLVGTVESIDSVLLPKAKECYEAASKVNWVEYSERLMKTDESARMDLGNRLTCGSLLDVAPTVWNENIAKTVPDKIEGLLKYSSQVLSECVTMVEKSDDTLEKARLNTLVQFCQGTHERALRRFEQFKQQVQLDTSTIVKGACSDALQSKVFGNTNGRQYGDLIQGALSEIPMEAAKNIKQKFSEKLQSDLQHLDIMEKDLQRALKSIMVVLKAKPNIKSEQFKQQVKQIQSSLAGNMPQRSTAAVAFMDLSDPYKKVQDDDMLLMKYQSEKSGTSSKLEPWATVAGVCAAFDDVEAPRFFQKSAWGQYDKRDPVRNARFEELLRKAGLVQVEVKLDQSCQFRALAHQVYGTEDAYSIVRLLVMSEFLSNPAVYERYMSTKGQQLQEYVAAMSKDSQYGDHLTLCAFANFYGSDVMVYSPMFPHPLLIQSRNPQTNRVFCISYVDENQYQSLAPTEPRANEMEKLKVLSPRRDAPAERSEVVAAVPSPVDIRHYALSGVIQESPMELEVKQPRAGNLSPVKIFTPLCLSELCIAKITQYVDMLPALGGALPEELVQRTLNSLLKARKIDDTVLERLLDPAARSLEIETCNQITDLSCRLITRTCDNLRRISFAGCINLGNEAVVQLAMNCNNLDSINLSGCVLVGNLGIQEIARKCPRLSFIDLTGCNKLTDIAITELALACSGLRSVIVRDCAKLTDGAFNYIPKSLTVLDASGCDQLTDVSILALALTCKELVVFKVSGRAITDVSVTQLAENCSGLQVVDLNGCELVTDASVKAIYQNCPMLEQLNVACCRNVSTDAFTSDARIFQNLISLDLTRCLNVTDAGVKRLAQDCANLEILNLSSCEDITDEAVIDIASRCKELKEVNLSKCMHITDASVIELAAKCNLTKLILYNCHKISNTSIAQLALNSQLRELDLSSIQNIDDTGILSVVSGCPFLEVLCLEECKLTEVGINHIAENGYSLKTLKLAYCKGVTNESLEKLGKGCPYMVHLDISYCNQVTVAGLKKVLPCWSDLKILSLRGFHQLTTEAIEHPNIRELNLSWCKNIQDIAVEQIAVGCQNLVNLDLAWAGKITANSVHKLAQKVSSLRFLNLRGCTKVSFLTLKYLNGGSIMIYT